MTNIETLNFEFQVTADRDQPGKMLVRGQLTLGRQVVSGTIRAFPDMVAAQVIFLYHQLYERAVAEAEEEVALFWQSIVDPADLFTSYFSNGETPADVEVFVFQGEEPPSVHYNMVLWGES